MPPSVDAPLDDFKRIIGAATNSYFIEAMVGQVNDIVYKAKLPG